MMTMNLNMMTRVLELKFKQIHPWTIVISLTASNNFENIDNYKSKKVDKFINFQLKSMLIELT